MTVDDLVRHGMGGPPDVIEIVIRAFVEVLGLDEVAPDEDFFDLGGHSVMAMRLIAHIHEATGLDITVRDVFDAPTAAELAARIQ